MNKIKWLLAATGAALTGPMPVLGATTLPTARPPSPTSAPASSRRAPRGTPTSTTVRLPRPRIGPIVFVTSAGGAWFAATGI